MKLSVTQSVSSLMWVLLSGHGNGKDVVFGR